MNHYINKVTFSEKLKTYRKHPLSFVMLLIIFLGAILTIGTLLYLIAYILITGIPNIKPELFEWEYNSENVSMMPAIINTITMTFLTLLMAVPVGIFSAIYLVEYAKKGNKLVSVIRITTETLSGIPSIVYGLFGFLMFNVTFKWGYSFLSGAITLAIMILPLIIRTTEEALLAVPDSYREGSFGLGAGKLRTVFRAVLPSAVPGILAGVILAIGRILSESAALLFTAGFAHNLNGFIKGMSSAGATLTVALYVYASERGEFDIAFAIASILMILTVIINLLTSYMGRLMKRRNGQ